MSYNLFSGSHERFNKNRTKNFSEFHINKATLKLLICSFLVSLSGTVRIYIASLLLKTTPNVIICIAGGLIIYSVYTLDRALDSEEDYINRKELNSSNKKIGLDVSFVTFVIGAFILAKDGMLVLAFIPIITGYLYSKGIQIGNLSLKLKGGLGVKNVVVGLSWGIFITGLACSGYENIGSIVLVFLLFGVKVFINSAIDDFKDVKGDTLAGIKTLPIILKARKTRNLLTAMHIFSHMIVIAALINGVLAFEPVIVLCSFVCGLICILNYTNEDRSLSRKLGLAFFKDGESTVILILRAVTGSFLI